MFKTCSRCGIVPDDHICPFKVQKKKDTTAGSVRNLSHWHKKSIEIRERDNYLCQVCLREKYNTQLKYNFSELEVHHIIPLEEDVSKAFDNDNLITLCRYHHELAERGDISRDELRTMIKNNNSYQC